MKSPEQVIGGGGCRLLAAVNRLPSSPQLRQTISDTLIYLRRSNYQGHLVEAAAANVRSL